MSLKVMALALLHEIQSDLLERNMFEGDFRVEFSRIEGQLLMEGKSQIGGLGIAMAKVLDFSDPDDLRLLDKVSLLEDVLKQ